MVAAIEEEALARWIAAAGLASVRAAIEPWVTPARRAKIDAVLATRLTSVILAIEDPQDAGNAAAIVRTAEAFGVAEVHVIASPGQIILGRRTARGALPWALPRDQSDRASFFAELRRRGIRALGACVDGGMTLPLADVPVDQPLCILLGSEQRGLSDEAMRACDLRFRIPTVGMVESLNVSVAAGIALHTITSRRREFIGAPGDLTTSEREIQRVTWYARSIDARLLAGLLAGDAPGRTLA